MIIDSHVHLGYDNVFDYEIKEKEITDSVEKYGIDISIVQPFIPRPYIKEHQIIHDRINSLCHQFPEKFKGMASINPHLYQKEVKRELERCVLELGFVGVKITPIGHAAHPSSKDCIYVYELAEEYGIPVMIHTGDGGSFADPIASIPAIKKFPYVNFILAHAGYNIFFEQALLIAKENENVYLEPSWLNILSTRTAIQVLGAQKIMFSSDDPLNIPLEIIKYKTLLNKPEELEMIFSGTALHIFKLRQT